MTEGTYDEELPCITGVVADWRFGLTDHLGSRKEGSRRTICGESADTGDLEDAPAPAPIKETFEIREGFALIKTLDEFNIVNYLDLQVFVDYWLCYYPTDWPLK